MSTEIVTLDTPELKALEPSKALKIKQTFDPMSEMLAEFEDSYTALIAEAADEITPEVTAKAKRLRLDIAKVRIETGKLKDKQKEYIKLEDKAIMGVHNILVWAVKEKEDNLKEIEKHFEIQEQKRLEELQRTRAELLSEFVEDAHERDLKKFEEDEFQALLEMKKKEKEDRIAAEKKAEEDRIAKEKAEAEERELIRNENERLKAEREEREAAERKKHAEYEAKLKAEREERERIEREERAKREAAEAELRAKEEAERKAKAEEEARIQAELNKGDDAKVKDLLKDLDDLKKKYTFKSAKNKKMYSDVGTLLEKVIAHINK